jgi:hypothetical protein
MQKRNEHLTSFEYMHYCCVGILMIFGLSMFISISSFRGAIGSDFLSHYASAVTGATMGFMVFFSLCACLFIPVGGGLVTRRRDGTSHAGIAFNCTYGTCLSLFGFIPLLVVSSALLQLAAGSQADVVAECYWDVKDEEYLKAVALPGGAKDVHLVDEDLSFSTKAVITMAHWFDRFSEDLVDQNMCTEHCPCWAGPTREEVETQDAHLF